MSEAKQITVQLGILILVVLLLLGLAVYEDYKEKPTVLNQEKIDCFDLEGEMYCKLSKP